MPLRGLVKFFAIAMILVCLFQLSIGYFVKNKESAISARVDKKLAAEFKTPQTKYPSDVTAQNLYADTLKSERVRMLISEEKKAAKERTAYWLNYKEAKDAQLRLGLDLQGGMSVTLEVAVEELVKKLCINKTDPNFTKAIQNAIDRKKSETSNFISIFRSEYEKIAPSSNLSGLFSGSSNGKLTSSSSNADVEKYLRVLADEAFATNAETLQKRLDGFGQGSAPTAKDPNTNTITIEMAGIKNPEDMKAVIVQSANLEMWEVANPTMDLISLLKRADAAYLADSAVMASGKKKKLEEIFKQGAGAQNALGVINEEDIEFFKERLRTDAYQSTIGNAVKIALGKPESNSVTKTDFVQIYALTTNGEAEAPISGSMVTEAKTGKNQLTGKAEVTLYLNKDGETKFDEMAAKLNGKGSIAVLLDNVVYSAPTINAPKFNGVAVISGSMNTKESEELKTVLNSGKMSVPMKIVNDYTVGATLGDDATKGGYMSFLIAFAVIFILMLVYYNTAGWVANIALIANLLFTVGFMSMLKFTLTAPGIAGLVLTIGMAVDTNVIIFERIKEELEKGKTYPEAVAEGYRRSLAPVLDAHFTTFLTAAILFYFGVGAIRGFGTTQMLGIVLSLFCGILFSRLITDMFTNKKRHLNYFTPISRRIFKHAQFKFIEYRKVTYIISLVVLLLGVAAIFNGFNTGIEYKGGKSYTVNFNKSIEKDALTKSITAKFKGSEPRIRTIQGSDKIYEITVSNEGSNKVADSIIRGELFDAIKSYLPADLTKTAFNTGSGTQGVGVIGNREVAAEFSEKLKSGAQKAAIYSILIIALYIFIRFRDWRYSLGTIIALLHDVFVTLAVFSFLKGIMPFPLELDQHFIAAVLTVIGFSMNDTIIVFDRVRENAKKMAGESKEVIINKSINETLSRTIMTSLTVFLTILILFIFGGEVTRGFAFAMLVGVIVGTYSSIFVAAPVLVDFAKNTPLGEADFVDHSSDETAKAEAAIK